jgi:hypothetical protein
MSIAVVTGASRGIGAATASSMTQRRSRLGGFLRESPRGEHPFDLGPITFIAPRPSTLVVIEVRQERESSAHVTLPTGEVDGMGELAQRVGSEVLLSAWPKNAIRVDRSLPAAVVYNIAPDLKRPEPAHNRLVDAAAGEQFQGEPIPAKGHASIARQLLGTRRLGVLRLRPPHSTKRRRLFSGKGGDVAIEKEVQDLALARGPWVTVQ